MPKLRHQTLVELFRDKPSLSLDLMRYLGYPVPEGLELRVVDSDLSTSKIVERRADLVTVGNVDGCPRLAVVTEIQLKCDLDKLASWPAYVFLAQASLHCRAAVLVVTTSKRVARWARRVREVAPGIHYAPLVLGPNDLPIPRSLREARGNLELAVLAALAHAQEPAEEAKPIVARALKVCRTLPGKAGVVYSEMILEALGPMLKEALVPLVETYKFRSEFAKKHQALGEARGERRGRLEGERRGRLEGERRGRLEGRREGRLEDARQSIRAAFKARRLPMTATAEKRIAHESNLRTLRRWLVRAITVEKASQIFDE